MLITLSYETDGLWHAYTNYCDASGPSIEEAFVALYQAMDESPGMPVFVVADHSRPAPGLYHILVTEGADGRLRAISQDILGLSLEADAEELMLQLPTKVSELLSGQEERYSKTA